MNMFKHTTYQLTTLQYDVGGLSSNLQPILQLAQPPSFNFLPIIVSGKKNCED